jgi:hypothetical protein
METVPAGLGVVFYSASRYEAEVHALSDPILVAHGLHVNANLLF